MAKKQNRSQAPQQVAQGACGISIPGYTQNVAEAIVVSLQIFFLFNFFFFFQKL